jgi:hypothetical protein
MGVSKIKAKGVQTSLASLEEEKEKNSLLANWHLLV